MNVLGKIVQKEADLKPTGTKLIMVIRIQNQISLLSPHTSLQVQHQKGEAASQK
jgi:hypothetical protein